MIGCSVQSGSPAPVFSNTAFLILLFRGELRESACKPALPSDDCTRVWKLGLDSNLSPNREHARLRIISYLSPETGKVFEYHPDCRVHLKYVTVSPPWQAERTTTSESP
jgi:hypothetical protein